MQAMQWDDLRYVLAIARNDTLAAAARRLGVNETTAARRLRAAETALGARLFDRVAGALKPTEAGERAIARAVRIEREFEAIDNAVGGANAAPSGAVRLTAVPILLNRLLIPALPAFLARYPDIRPELIADARNLSLTRREADLALRLARPREGTALARRIGWLDYAVVAPRRGNPDKLRWITYEESLAHLPQARWIAGQRRAGDAAPLLVNDAEGVVAAVRAGLGKSLLPSLLASREPGLRVVAEAQPVLSREIWLLVHPELRPLARVSAVIAWLEAVVTAWSPRRKRLRGTP
jgi:DNA-binding transcriptional LysR family regulator